MPITAKKLMEVYPPTEDEQRQFANLAQSMSERLSRQIAECAASSVQTAMENLARSLKESLSQQMRVIGERHYEPYYFPPLPIQRQSNPTIVINLIFDPQL